MTTIHKTLPHLEPGFMVPLPRFICILLDWLFVGWNARCHKAIAEEDSAFVDEDGLFTEDEERKLLRSLTVSRSVNARSLRLNTCVESMEICGEELPVFDMDQRRLGNFIRNQEARTEPVRVGRAASGGASVGPEAGECD